jgi:cytochrome P450
LVCHIVFFTIFILFFIYSVITGYETTSTALSYIFYVLATHPNEQQKLQEHIDTHFHSDSEDSMPSYDTVRQMDYLVKFIRETLRMYPVLPIVINRQSTEEFHIKNIGTISAATRIVVDMYSLHFNPERFASKRHPMTWIQFGAGPRNCIGMRFALIEIKILLVRLVKTYLFIDRGNKTHQSFEQLREGFVIAP